MEGVLKTMATAKLTLLTTTVLVAGLVTTGAGVAAYSVLGRDDGLAGRAESRTGDSQKPDGEPSGRPEAGGLVLVGPAA